MRSTPASSTTCYESPARRLASPQRRSPAELSGLLATPMSTHARRLRHRQRRHAGRLGSRSTAAILVGAELLDFDNDGYINLIEFVNEARRVSRPRADRVQRRARTIATPRSPTGRPTTAASRPAATGSRRSTTKPRSTAARRRRRRRPACRRAENRRDRRLERPPASHTAAGSKSPTRSSSVPMRRAGHSDARRRRR